jgi:fucose permease
LKHSRLKEIFTGRRNILTVTAVFIGGYFIAYPLVNLTMDNIGPYWTMAVGLAVLIIGDYILDAFHKKHQ